MTSLNCEIKQYSLLYETYRFAILHPRAILMHTFKNVCNCKCACEWHKTPILRIESQVEFKILRHDLRNFRSPGSDISLFLIITFYHSIKSFYRIIMSFYRIIIAIYRNNYSDISNYYSDIPTYYCVLSKYS